jgi:hypothetical protein
VTRAVAVVVSQSSSTVRLFADGRIVKELEAAHRRERVRDDTEDAIAAVRDARSKSAARQPAAKRPKSPSTSDPSPGHAPADPVTAPPRANHGRRPRHAQIARAPTVAGRAHQAGLARPLRLPSAGQDPGKPIGHGSPR